MKNILQKLDKVSVKIFITLAFFLPLFFIPSQSVGFETTKIAFVFGVVVASLLSYLVASVVQGKLTIPAGVLPRTILGILIVACIAGIVSPVPWKSLIGNGFEIYTVATLFVLALMALIAAVNVRKTSDQVYVLVALLSGSLISMFYTLARFIFGADFLSFGYFTSLNQTLFGSVSEASVVVAILAVVVAYILQTIKGTLPTVALWLFEIIAIVFLVATNVSFSWVIVAVGSLLVLVIRYVRSGPEVGIIVRAITAFTPAAIILIVVSCVGIFAPQFTASVIAQRINLNETTIRPSWQASVDILAQSIKLRPFVGIGPNRYSTLYVLTRPANVNVTPGWNIDFESGVSYIFTLVTTYGLLMFAALITFGIFAFKAFRQILVQKGENIKVHIQTVAALGAGLSMVSLLFINPTATSLGVLALFGGIVLALQENGTAEVSLIRANGKRHYVNLAVLGITIVVIIAVSLLQIQNFRAHIKLGNAFVSVQEGNIENALVEVQNAAAIAPMSDVYHRSTAEIAALGMQALIQSVSQSGNSKKIDDATMERFKNLLEGGSAFATEAIRRDPTNYLNNLAEIHVAEAGLLLGAQNAYEVVNAGYERALALNPSSATLYLNRAMAEFIKNDYEKAQTYATNALYLKSDYVDAIMMLARIDLAQNKSREAVSLVERAVQAMPQNPRIAFELGALKYSLKNYSGALVAFEQAATLVPGDANVQYYRGVTLAQLNRRTDALAVLSPLADANPQNADLAQIVANLRSGKNPFGGVEDPTPEKTTVDSKQKAR